jgi:predicted MFS family arabinose efflux permease
VNTHDARPLPAAFARLAWSNLAAQSAEQIGLAAAPIVAVVMLGAGVEATGWLQTAQTLPFVLLAIPAGLLADRTSRRLVMTGAEALRALSLLLLVALAYGTWLTVPLLTVLGFVGACGTVAYSVAAPALVPALVPPGPALAVANARIELARTLAYAGGPALAGALVAWTGGAVAFGVAAALSLVAVSLLARLCEPRQMAAGRHDALQEMREGAAFVFGHQLLRPIFVTQVVFNAAFFTLQAVYVPYAIERLGLSASAVGITLATYGVGMIVGALLAGRIIRAIPFGRVIALGPIAGLAGALVMVLTIWMPSALLAALSFFLIGAGPIVWVISTATLRQTVTPPALLGRVSAINITAYGARPAGAALGAIVGGAYGAETCLLVAAAGFAVQAAVIVLSPAVRLVRQPEAIG